MFLGLNLLVTDPATSPKTQGGKFLFGFAYGTTIFALYLLLRGIQQPSYFDKILAVPVVNLMVSSFDRMALRIRSLFGERTWLPRLRSTNPVYMGFYVVTFLALVPYLKTPVVEYEDPLPPHAVSPSPEMRDRLANRFAFSVKYPDASGPFDFVGEVRRYRQYHGLEPDTAAAHRNFGIELRRRGLADAAVDELVAALDELPDDPELRYNLGLALQATGKRDEAIQQFRATLEIDPSHSGAQEALGSVGESR